MYTKDQMLAIAGKPWTSGNGKTRVYFNDWPQMIGLEIDRYRTGNISDATLGGKHISNAAAGRLLAGTKVYWEDGQIFSTLAKTADREYLDGDALAKMVDEAIAARVAALTETGDRNG